MVTVSWKTINCDQVILLPYGPVDYEGELIIEIKQTNSLLNSFELLAENTVSGIKQKRSIVSENFADSIKDNDYYKNYLKRKEQLAETKKTSSNEDNDFKKQENHKSSKFKLICLSIIVFILIILVKVFRN